MDNPNRGNQREKELKKEEDPYMKPANVRVKQEDCSMDSDRKRKMPLVDPPQSKRATMNVKEELVEGDESAGHDQQMPAKGLPEGPTNQHKGKCTCDVCGMVCKWPSHLEIHMRTHTGERPFVCKKCGIGFPRKFYLTQHQVKCGRRKEVPKTQLTVSSVDHTSESRRAGELDADNEIQDLRKELERLTEEIGNYRRENLQMKMKSFASDSRHRQLQAEIGELRLQLNNKLQDSESRRTREMEAEDQDLRRELEKVMEESSKMKDERLESDARNGQLQAEVQELRKELERSEQEKKKSLKECRKMEGEHLELKKKMQQLAYSLTSHKESEARRDKLRCEMERATEESGQSLEECRQLIIEQLGGSPHGDGAQSEEDNSYLKTRPCR